ncbi:n-acetylmuramoyl-l-alanine amidase [Lucifera butyrica]|uniref:N-acetylmuramoyl-l-alanine amidase n=1 Tax=Lucifera butyrica TaxID=1351585 RepID=A0A498RC49_9FIRM|nr:N-acetylmuramoyl-L-alanine amidase [Lucifera butyrica]VBB07822.1 n-acetylmuramoyl-l-alanine amidase [Lucifera butyrica]
MSKIKMLCLLLLLLCIPQTSWASSTNSSQVKLSDVRFFVHTDAISGEKKLRVVIDVTGPVQASASLNSGPAPNLTVDVSGASPGPLAGQISLDGNIATDISILSTGEASSRLILHLPQSIDDSAYRLFTLPANKAANRPFRIVIDINQTISQATFHFTPGLRGKVIAIDPGHGGTDSGAIGPDGIMEKTVTLDVALKVKQLLEQAGATVYMSRVTDRDVYAPNDDAIPELAARAAVGNKNKADVFVDIHANSFVNPSVGGTATYYYPKTDYDKLLAQNIQDQVVAINGLTDRGVREANFYVLKHTLMPAFLIEMAFISNPNEEKLLTSPQFQQKMAQGIVNGLDAFFTQAAQLGGNTDASQN